MPTKDQKPDSETANLLGKPKFAEPGSIASVPDDRNLLQAMTQEEIEDEQEKAEAILDGDMPPEPAPPKKEPSPPLSPDPILEAMAEMQETIDRDELDRMLCSIETTGKKWANKMLKANKRGLASDFNTLIFAAKQVRKRTEGL